MNSSDATIGTRSRIHATIPKELAFFILFILAVVFILWPARVDAATINVSAGSDAINSDSICQLDEAIANLNGGSRVHTDCVETGAYGTNDTINLPAGTITGTGGMGADSLAVSSKIVGQGKDISKIENRGLQLYGGSTVGGFELIDFSTEADDGIEIIDAESITIDGLDIDFATGGGTGLYISGSPEVDIRNTYVHNFDLTGSGLSAGIFIYASDANPTTNITIENTTIAEAAKGIALGYLGSIYSGSGTSVVNATIKNSTFSNIASPNPNEDDTFDSSGNSYAIGVQANGTGPSDYGQVNYTTVNNTFNNTRPNTYSTAIYEMGVGYGRINHRAQNNLFAMGSSSGSANYRNWAADGASPEFATTSDGGNISNDSSYVDELDKPSDKHNSTNLASFLGALADNGGSVPTLAILEGSPAIDAGTDVLGMTTDARGSSRPQGTGFDVGAYESAFSADLAGAGDENGDSQGGGLAETGQDFKLPTLVSGLLILIAGAYALSNKLKRRFRFTRFR